MKILYIHQYFKFPDETGGTRSYDLAKKFKENNIDVEFLAATSDENKKGGKKWNTIKSDGITVHYIYLPYDNQLSYLKRCIVFLKFLWSASLKALSIKADIVLATSTPLTIGIPAILKKKIQKTPYIFEVRDVWPEAVIAVGVIKNKIIQKLLYKLEKTIYKNASTIVTLSSDMKHSITSRYLHLNKPVKVIENISEINRFQNNIHVNKSLIKEMIGFIPRFSILYAGTFGKVNGIDYVIHLAEKVFKIDDSIIFILIGNGSEKQRIRELAEEKGILNKSVFIFDPVAKKNLPQLYYETDIGSSFVTNIPELWANSANKFFDALAAGRPILINYKGWQEKIIRADNIGYILSPNIEKVNVEEFVKYTYDNALQKTQRINALQKAKEAYSLEKAVEKYLDVINRLNVLSFL